MQELSLWDESILLTLFVTDKHLFAPGISEIPSLSSKMFDKINITSVVVFKETKYTLQIYKADKNTLSYFWSALFLVLA